jgi:hypothetical protein
MRPDMHKVIVERPRYGGQGARKGRPPRDLDRSAANRIAAHSDATPELGTVLAVGKVVGRVVRHFPGGFAVKFVSLQDPRIVEELLMSR